MKRLLLISGGIGLILLLAAAAFIAGRLLNAQPQAANAGAAGPVELAGNAEPGQRVGPALGVSVELLPAPELPASPETVSGVFVKREDNTFFVGTGNIRLGLTPEQGPQGGIASADYDGPVVEVVVTRATHIYHDETPAFFSSEVLDKGTTIQQVVRRVNEPDNVGQNSILRVWGQKRGDRVVAEVLVYDSLDGN